MLKLPPLPNPSSNSRKPLNEGPSKLNDSCGASKGSQGEETTLCLPHQSPLESQSCCVCCPFSHSKSFTYGDSRESHSTALQCHWEDPHSSPASFLAVSFPSCPRWCLYPLLFHQGAPVGTWVGHHLQSDELRSWTLSVCLVIEEKYKQQKPKQSYLSGLPATTVCDPESLSESEWPRQCLPKGCVPQT